MTQTTKEIADQNKDEQYILDELSYAVERDSWFEINGRSSSILQAMLKSKDAEIERLQKGFVWLDDTIEGHLLLNPENKDSKLIQEIKRKISFILSNGGE
jgi:ABC-type polar amino acid transport system ATPase subunit